ncbi:MAG: filamentous hemagglutinin family protein [Methylococcales bacterium]
MDISAQNIDVVNQFNNSTTGLQILAQDLNNLQVDSLLLGGSRSFDNVTGNTQLTVSADNVIFDKGVQVKALDLLAVGNNSVEVKTGASITSSGHVNTGDSVFNITGDSALLRVSADKQVKVNRSYLSGSTPGSTGDLLIDKGATLSATQSMFLDASKSTVLNGGIKLSGGSINMTASNINLGEVAGIKGNSLNLSNQNLSNLIGNDLTLTSLSSINFYGNVGQLNSSNTNTPLQFNHLVLDTAALSGYKKAGNAAMLQAKTIDLQNSKGVSASQSGTGTGVLDLTATQFNQGKGNVSLDGFSSVNINVNNQFTTTGNSVLNLASDLNLTAGLINATGGHSLLIDASSGVGHDVHISGNSNNTQAISNDFGGSIAVSANNIALQDANVLLPSGSLKLNSQAGDVVINGKTNINLAGQSVNFADVVSYTPGGTFSAISTHGIVSLGKESSVDISTGGGNASGGNLTLKAPQKTVELAGKLKAIGANATIDVSGFLPTQSFDSLMNKLMTAGVNQALYVRSRAGDIVENQAITAKTISLVADAGSIDINGKLSTNSATQAGNISLYAGNNLTLESGGILSATGAKGGNVLLSALGTTTTPGGIIALKNGSSINVTGSSSLAGTKSAGGTVTLDAMRTDTVHEKGINIAPIAGTVKGANGFYAVGFQKYDASFISSMNTNIVDVVAGLSTSIPTDIFGYLSSLYPNTDLTSLSTIIATDISNYLANVSFYTSKDIPGLSNIITADVSAYMSANVSPITNSDISSMSSTIATDMSTYLTSYSTDIAGLSGTIKTDINGYLANASAIRTSLGHGIALRSGVEVDNASGSTTLASIWDFSGLSNNGLSVNNNPDPSITYQKPIVGDLIVRSAGQLNINAALTDGYLNGGPALMRSDSWSFHLVSGADLSSADTMATNSLSATDKLNNPGISDLTLGSGASVHTGTGDIKLASAGNIVFADKTATVYSGGRSTVTNPYGTLDNNQTGTGSLAGQTLYTTDTSAAYPISGGSIVFQAGADIIGAVSDQFIQAPPFGAASWLEVQGTSSFLSAWMVNANYFKQNVGSFGGGVVDISAAGNINDLSVMMPTTGKQLGTDFPNSTNRNSLLDVQGGGLMNIAAGGNISGGAYFLGKGVGNISAVGEINGSSSTDPNAFASGPQLVMSGNQSDAVGGNTLLSLNANQGIKISGVSDAMILNHGGTQFFSYTDKSKLTLNSLAGDIHLNSDTSVISTILQLDTTTDQKYLAHVYPASLDATAFNGSVKLDSDIILFPSAVSNLNILAKQAITSSNGQYSLTMSDANPALIATALNPIISGNSVDPVYSIFNTLALDTGLNLALFHADTPIHTGDKIPARLVTQQGDISSVQINLPKQAIIQAGNDLLNSSINIQQILLTDASIISAGRDIKFVTDLNSDGNPTAKNDTYKIQIAGPGDVLIKTGRNLDLGASVGLSSVGNIYNPALPSTGANLDVLVGLNAGTPNYAAFIDKYLVTNPLYVDQYTLVKSLITSFMKQESGNNTLTDAKALAAFKALAPNRTLSIQPQLNSILTSVFFNELKIAGTASASDKTKGNAGGFAAIDTLFPGNQWQGDLTLFFSKLQTVSGGDINLMVPGGQVNAGQAVAPSGAGAKTADQLGIVAQSTGSINAFVKNDFIVNTSRVFTLGGGDIEIWSSEGNIDAGKGAKSALSVTVDPPYFDITNKLVIPAPKITSGSGIRTAASTGVVPGNVFLFAPKGVVDAGEAGIGGTNVTISATAVLGANNISVGGVSAGVPAASTGSVAAGLTGTSNMTANVSQVAQAATEQDKDKEEEKKKNMTLGMLSVEFIGFGE